LGLPNAPRPPEAAPEAGNEAEEMTVGIGGGESDHVIALESARY
jgi:hypothetical protein